MQAYLIECLPSGKRYVGITSGKISKRWSNHVFRAKGAVHRSALYSAIVKYGRGEFTVTPLCSSRSWADLCAIETELIKQWQTLAPSGYNLTHGGEGRVGSKQSPEAIEKSAAKHRGKKIPEDAIRLRTAKQRGLKRSSETRALISAARTGKRHSGETKAKLSAYWKERRASGGFKTSRPYEHHRAQRLVFDFGEVR